MAAFALLLAIQVSSMPTGLPSSPSIWSPPRSIPAPAQSLPVAQTGATEHAGALAVQVRRQITAELRSGEISHAQARAFRRDLAAVDSCSLEGFGEIQGTQSVNSLEALSSLIYAAGSVVTPK